MLELLVMELLSGGDEVGLVVDAAKLPTEAKVGLLPVAGLLVDVRLLVEGEVVVCAVALFPCAVSACMR